MESYELIEKVSNLFTQYGIKSVTMDDISRQLGISKKTLYQYVNDKTELVTKTIEHGKQRMTECFSEELNEKNKNAIQHLIDVARHVQTIISTKNPSLEYDLKKYYPELFREFDEFRNKMMYESVLRNLKQGMEEGLYRSDMKVEYIARFYISRVETIIHSDLTTFEVDNPSEFFKEVFNYHIRGIASKEGLVYLEEHVHELSNYNPNKTTNDE